MRISDWSSYVCSSDLLEEFEHLPGVDVAVEGDDLLAHDEVANAASWEARRKVETLRRLSARPRIPGNKRIVFRFLGTPVELLGSHQLAHLRVVHNRLERDAQGRLQALPTDQTSILARSEEHTSELQSLMRN